MTWATLRNVILKFVEVCWAYDTVDEINNFDHKLSDEMIICVEKQPRIGNLKVLFFVYINITLLHGSE